MELYKQIYNDNQSQSAKKETEPESYFEVQKIRKEISGPSRIETSLTLRHEFYSAMWLY